MSTPGYPTLAEIQATRLKTCVRSATPYLREAMDETQTMDHRMFCWREAYNHTHNALWAMWGELEKIAPNSEVLKILGPRPNPKG